MAAKIASSTGVRKVLFRDVVLQNDHKLLFAVAYRSFSTGTANKGISQASPVLSLVSWLENPV